VTVDPSVTHTFPHIHYWKKMKVRKVVKKTPISRARKPKIVAAIPPTHKWARRIQEIRENGFTHSLVVKKSRVSGSGLFTREPIRKNEIIIEYMGQVWKEYRLN